MKIETYSGKYDDEIISLIIGIQNCEAKIGLSLEKQPDLLNISLNYQDNGGEFWIALNDGKVIGTIGLMIKENHCAVLKKFFVNKEFRSKKVGLALYKKLIKYAEEKGVQSIILDTPAVAHESHKFYRRAVFQKITPDEDELPVSYFYPDRNSILYILNL